MNLVGGLVADKFRAQYFTRARQLERLMPLVCKTALETDLDELETTLDGHPVLIKIERKRDG